MSDNSPIDWALFHFPPRPGHHDTERLPDLAPIWAAPPTRVRSWHFDPSNKIIIHPVLRKKIDLSRLSTVRRLVLVAKTVSEQTSDSDALALQRALDAACRYFFGESLAETLASGRTELTWFDPNGY